MKKSAVLLLFSLFWQLTFLAQSADLSLDLSVDQTLVEAGQQVTFTIVVTNDGPDMATGVLVMDKLPSGFQFVSANPAMGTYNHVSGIWTIGNLADGGIAVLTVTANVKPSGDYISLAEVMASNLLDYDSVPGNGVDTDGDGAIADDPQDEDDGDGQIVVVAGGDGSSGSPPSGGSASGYGNCLAPAVKVSSTSPNPTDIDGSFKFDYKIHALLNFKMADTEGFNPEYFKGSPNQLEMEYYVNSADGSILFPGGEMGFFKTNFSYSDRFRDVDAAIWRPNGQMVVYGVDKREGKKRAVTRESSQTAEGRYQNDFVQIQRFMESSLEWGEWREPLPSRVEWEGDVVGYKADLPEAYTGLTNTWILYFDKAPTPIITSVPMMGYMVGVLKDVKETNCNRLVVYSQVLIGGHDSGDAIEVELKSIRPMGITFDGNPYQPMVLGGDPGTPMALKMGEYESKLRDIELRKESLERLRSRCSTDSCREALNRQLEDLHREKSVVICKQMEAMGMENFAECMRIEEEGY